MDIREKLHLVVYRVREKGLEVFVRDSDDDQYELPEAVDAASFDARESIELDAFETDEERAKGLAIEGDYHDIPSLKGLFLNDARKLRAQIRELPSAEEGTFVAVKEVAKRLLPGQYRMLKELREILVDRNSTKYM
ncbi:MAG: hypothetical protein AB8F78_02705 [Saprospiraceae bacterium]